MSSKVLYDSRNNEIKRVQPKPKGTAPLSSFDSICKSARIAEDEKEFMETLVIENNLLTNQVIEEYRIVNGEFIQKPKIKITADKHQQSLANDDDVNITVEIVDTLENETFNSIDLYIENANITITLTDNSGSKVFTFSSIGKYEIGCSTNDFRCKPIEIEVLE